MKLQVMLFTAAIAVLYVAYEGSEACAQTPEIGIENGFGYPLHVWIWPRNSRGWVKPAPYLTRTGSVKLRLQAPGDYYILARDSAGNDDPLGWVNMHEVVDRAPSARFVIDGQYVSEVRTQTYTVTRQVPEQRTRTVRVWRNGRWIEIEQAYTVYVPVQEEKTREVEVAACAFAKG